MGVEDTVINLAVWSPLSDRVDADDKTLLSAFVAAYRASLPSGVICYCGDACFSPAIFLRNIIEKILCVRRHLGVLEIGEQS